MKKYLILQVLLALTIQNKAQTVTDTDGNTYNTVTIGSQVWMKENLKTTKYNNGITIPNVTSDAAWSVLTSGAYCNYNNTSSYVSTYGRLYNYFALIDSNNLCPIGWHVPSIEEWNVLIDFLVDSVAAGKMKSTTTDWKTPNWGATNESGFTALPVGLRYGSGGFGPLGFGAYYGTSSEHSSNQVYDMELHYNDSETHGTDYNEKTTGFSVRCIKDSSPLRIIHKKADEVDIYPNPANDKLFINHSKSMDVQVIIFDLQGKKVFSKQIVNNYIDISKLNKGIYIIEIMDSYTTFTNKLIKN